MTTSLSFDVRPLAFDKQFMAMRYLLLGLMESRPDYKPALVALEAAAPYRATYLKDPARIPVYQANLLQAFSLLGKLASMPDAFSSLAFLLTPDFKRFPVDAVLARAAYEGEDELGQPAALPIALGAVTGEFDKLFISMQFYLLGIAVHQPQYQVAYDALIYASKIHVGVRKNGITPEFQHQLEIAHLIRTMLRGLMHPAETLAAIFLHDTPEDYDVPRAELDRLFGPMVADAAMLLNKYDEQGQQKPLDAYYEALGRNPITSVAKPGDNGQNQSSMAGVFTYKKQFEYSLNIKNRGWDMMKVARRLFPEQESVYENLKFLLRIQYNAVQAMLTALEFDPTTGEIHPALQA
jgi:hypothetical protein